ncbi:uncharacterized protein LOC34619818 [Cyclospora cayetanensis]|uniref:Uncharacterized protein LOC34619818 n=1 Tax=Cyclospora cayetanensis TaxID=88456 RepID=A0A6P6S3A7_9EIME|nr:uncharacterized protein LOC34619818 [Cyclospora cayetanensis]
MHRGTLASHCLGGKSRIKVVARSWCPPRGVAAELRVPSLAASRLLMRSGSCGGGSSIGTMLSALTNHQHGPAHQQLLHEARRRPFFDLPAAIVGLGEPQQMLQHHESHVSRHRKEEYWDVVRDVASYKDFIPWCSDSGIFPGAFGGTSCESPEVLKALGPFSEGSGKDISEGVDVFDGYLSVSLGLTQERFTSRVYCLRCADSWRICCRAIDSNLFETLVRSVSAVTSAPKDSRWQPRDVAVLLRRLDVLQQQSETAAAAMQAASSSCEFEALTSDECRSLRVLLCCPSGLQAVGAAFLAFDNEQQERRALLRTLRDISYAACIPGKRAESLQERNLKGAKSAALLRRLYDRFLAISTHAGCAASAKATLARGDATAAAGTAAAETTQKSCLLEEEAKALC